LKFLYFYIVLHENSKEIEKLLLVEGPGKLG